MSFAIHSDSLGHERQQAEDDEYVLVLTGNVHAFAAPGAPWDESFRSMTVNLMASHPVISLRDTQSGFDWLQVILVISALATDAVALWAIADRIGEFGASPNRMAALGVNLLLLANLAVSALLYIRFLQGRCAFSALERWQTGYLPVYAAWAAIVVVAFPPLFGFE